ncbi:MAG: hypothetical protein KDC46_04215 [Thermoleophilia bacterium]|nr:hypothetical protein [Thermoleophilia bacterium]
MSDAPATSTPGNAPDQPVRSTQAVLLVLGLLLLIPIIALIVAFFPGFGGGGGAGSAVVDSIDTGKVQAIYLTNDVVYFGLVDDSAHGDFFTLRDAFYLRSASTDEQGKDKDTAGQLVPVPVSSEVGGDGDLHVNANEVVRIQTLKDDSDIAKAIDVKGG